MRWIRGWSVEDYILGLFCLFALLVFVGAIAALVFHIPSAPPSLFCANGTTVQASPATEIVGKVPVQGVRYTCS